MGPLTTISSASDKKDKTFEVWQYRWRSFLPRRKHFLGPDPLEFTAPPLSTLVSNLHHCQVLNLNPNQNTPPVPEVRVRVGVGVSFLPAPPSGSEPEP